MCLYLYTFVFVLWFTRIKIVVVVRYIRKHNLFCTVFFSVNHRKRMNSWVFPKDRFHWKWLETNMSHETVHFKCYWKIDAACNWILFLIAEPFSLYIVTLSKNNSLCNANYFAPEIFRKFIASERTETPSSAHSGGF